MSCGSQQSKSKTGMGERTSNLKLVEDAPSMVCLTQCFIIVTEFFCPANRHKII